MSINEHLLLTMPVDFAVILKHIEFRFAKANHSEADLSSMSDIKELVSDLIEDINETCLIAKPDIQSYEIDTTGLIYCLIWLESYSFALCGLEDFVKSSAFDKATLLANDKFLSVKKSIDHENVPCLVPFTTALRIYDAVHERLIDAENVLRIAEQAGSEQLVYFINKLEGTTRTFRYLDWNYYNQCYSYS